MESLLVAGAETMVGANFAAQLAEQFDVSAVFFDSPRTLAGCRAISCRPDDARSTQELIRDLAPRRLIYCGVGANSAWTNSTQPSAKDAARAELWLNAARTADCSVTLISSDAVFTGPWMFHAENGKSLCPSVPAAQLQTIERIAQEIVPECLIIRTNAFGWSGGWVETLLANLETHQPSRSDCVRHASPILVNDLIDIVARCWQAGLDGVYHVGGAERTNPAAFAQRLAAEFTLRIPKPPATESLTDRTNGFGQSETSLQTRKVRRALGVSVPLLSESLRRLRQLSLNGFRDRLNPPQETLPPAKVA